MKNKIFKSITSSTDVGQNCTFAHLHICKSEKTNFAKFANFATGYFARVAAVVMMMVTMSVGQVWGRTFDGSTYLYFQADPQTCDWWWNSSPTQTVWFGNSPVNTSNSGIIAEPIEGTIHRVLVPAGTFTKMKIKRGDWNYTGEISIDNTKNYLSNGIAENATSGTWDNYVDPQERVLNGTEVMFYYGSPENWGNNKTLYLRSSSETSSTLLSSKGTTSYKSGMYLAIGCYNLNSSTTYYLSNDASWGGNSKSGLKAGCMADMNGDVTSATGVCEFTTTNYSISEGDASVSFSTSVSGSSGIGSSWGSLKYYYKPNSTWEEFDPNNVSSLAVGTYTIYALVSDGHIFVRSTNSATLTVSSAASTYTLTVAKGANITSVSGGKADQATVPFSSDITATPAAGYDFGGWTASPVANATFGNASNASTTVTVNNGSVTVTASATEHMNTITIVGGTAASTTAGIATTGTATAAEPAGKRFTGWTVPGSNFTLSGCTTTDKTITFNATAAGTVTANYEDAENCRLYYKNTSGWMPYAYVWNSETSEKISNWPGEDMSGHYVTIETTKYYYIDFDSSVGYNRVVFNDNNDSRKTEDITFTSSDCGKYWDGDSWEALPAVCVPTTFTLKNTKKGDFEESFTPTDTPNEYEVTFELKNDIINNLYVEDNCGHQYGCSDAIQPGKCIRLMTAESTFDFQSASQDKHWHYTFNSSTLELCSDAKPEEEKGFVVTYASGANGTMTAVKTEGGATVPSGSTVPSSTSVTFTATPGDDYDFSGWYAESDFSGAQISSANPYVITITADCSIYPKFTSRVTRITNLAVADANVGGKVTVTPTVENPSGTTYYYCYTVTNSSEVDITDTLTHFSCDASGVLTFDAPAVGTYTVTLNLKTASNCSGEAIATASKKFEVRDNITTIYLLTMYNSNVSMWSFNRSEGFVVTEGWDRDPYNSGYRIEMVKVGDVTIGGNTRHLYRASYSGTHKFIFYIKNGPMQEADFKISGDIDGKGYINTSYYFDLQNVSYPSTTTKTYTESPFKSISNSLAQTEVYCAGVSVELDAMLTTASSLKNSGATVTTTYTINDAPQSSSWSPSVAGNYTLKATSTDVSNIQSGLYAAAEATTSVNIKDCDKIVVTAHNNNCWNATAPNFQMQMHYQLAASDWAYADMTALPGFADWYYYEFVNVGSVNNWQIKGYTTSNVPGDYTQDMGVLTGSGCYTINRTADGESYKSNNQTMTASDCPSISVSLAASATSNLPGSTITLTATEPTELNETGKAAAVYTYYYKSSKDKDWIKIDDGAPAVTAKDFTPDNTEAETYSFMVTVSYDNGMDIYVAQSEEVKVSQKKPTLTVYIPNANKIVSGHDFSIAPYLDDYEGTPNVIVCYDIFENEDCTSRATYAAFTILDSKQGVKTSISTIGTYYVKVTVKNECGGKEIVSVVTPITIVADYIELKVDGETLVGSTIRFTATSSSSSTIDFVFTQKHVTSAYAIVMGTVHHTEEPYPSGYVDYAFDHEGTYDVTVTRGELTATVRIYVTEASYFFSPTTGEADSYVIMSRMDDGRYYVVNPYVDANVFVATSSAGANKETFGTDNVTKPGDTNPGDNGIYIYSPVTNPTTLEFVKDALYRVASDYNDGQDTYYSNIVTAGVSTDAANVSFFAQQAGKLTLEKLVPANDTVKWTKVGDLSHAGIKSDDVYTAILDPSAGTISGTARYTGNFYIYGAVPKYEPDDTYKALYWTQDGAGKMTAFTKITETEFFNHYYCVWISHDEGKYRTCDMAATVGNELNHSLAHMLGSKKLRGVSVRYGYDNTTNYFGRAFIDGYNDNKDGFLRAVGTNVYKEKEANNMYDNLTSSYAKFDDVSDWVYTSEVFAKPGNPAVGATIKLAAYYTRYNGANPPDYVLSDINDPGYEFMFYGWYKGEGGNEDKCLRFLLTYDFKTNRFTVGWYPYNTEAVEQDVEVDANLLVMRKAGSTMKPNIFNLAPDKSVTIVRRIYTVLELNRSELFNKDQTLKDGMRSKLFQLSVPYDVPITNISGLPNYGTKWVVQDYKGELRAKLAAKKDYWANLGWTDGNVLKAQRGYVISHNFGYGDFSQIDKGKGVVVSLMRLMIPSEVSESGHKVVNTDNYEPTRLAEIPCAKAGHKDVDANWRAIGLPGFFSAKANESKTFNHIIVDSNGFPIYTEGNPIPKMETSPTWLYEWNGEYGSYLCKDLHDYALNPTSSYLMQFYGQIDWEAGEYRSPISPVQSRIRSAYASNGENSSYSVEKYCLHMENADGKNEDDLYVVLNPKGSLDYVQMADLQKLFTTGAPQIYTHLNGESYAANDLPDTVKMVAMGINLPESGTYTFRLEDAEQSHDMLLLDSVMHVYTDLTAGETYSFLGDGGNVTDRFYLVFGERKNPIVTELAHGELSEARVSTIGNRIQVSGVPAGSSLTLIDMLGRIVYIDSASSESVVTSSLPTGVYHLLIQSNTDSSVAKVVIR